jgi:lipopolysaccharide export system permease protein
MEKIDKFIDQSASIWIVFEYYLYFSPEIVELMTPIAALLATLFSVGKLSTNNEITAMKSGGISLYKIMFPYVMMSFIISFGHLYFNGWIVPRAQTHKIVLEQKYLNKVSNSMNLVNVHFRDTPVRNILIGYYDVKGKYASNVAIETYTSEYKPRLSERFESEKIQWNSKNREWMAYKALVRHYLPDGTVTMQKFDSTNVTLSLNHEQIVKLKMSTKEMTFPEFKDYIDLLKKGGKDIRRQLIEYHGNYAFPFANLIVILFGVPFASVRKKGGIAIQISAALVISFLYILFTKVSQTIGYYIDITPVLVAWIANILFLLSSLFVLWKTRT